MKERVNNWIVAIDMRSWAPHSARTAIAAAIALGIANLARLPEAFWAPITTLIVMQSTLGVALAVSKDRLIGTVLGAIFGVVLANYIAVPSVSLAIGVFVLGLLCAVLRLNLAAYRFAGVTLAVIVLITRAQAPWLIGLYRLSEVALGIVVGLATSAIWPMSTAFADGRRPTKA